MISDYFIYALAPFSIHALAGCYVLLTSRIELFCYNNETNAFKMLRANGVHSEHEIHDTRHFFFNFCEHDNINERINEHKSNALSTYFEAKEMFPYSASI